MRNLLAEKDRYYAEFGDAMYSQMLQMRYGIESCPKGNKLCGILLRKQMLDYQVNDDSDAFTQVSINHMTWLPVYYPLRSEYVMSSAPWQDLSRYHPVTGVKSGINGISVGYPNGTGSDNIIEVNSGGCITRININPVINYNQNSSYIHNQSVPSMVWDIVHNMGIVPNVFTEDSFGTDLSGIITVIDGNHITISFNSPQSGKAYLT
jgi:hypothetical protein